MQEDVDEVDAWCRITSHPTLNIMSRQYFVNIRWISGNVPCPRPESAMAIHRTSPLRQELALRLLLLIVLSLYFKDQHLPVR